MTPIDLRQVARGERDTNSRASGGGAPGTGVGQAGDPAYTVSERGQAVAVNRRTGTRQGDDTNDPAPDGRRYAAVGDAVTVNVAEWIGRRLALAEAGEL